MHSIASINIIIKYGDWRYSFISKSIYVNQYLYFYNKNMYDIIYQSKECCKTTHGMLFKQLTKQMFYNMTSGSKFKQKLWWYCSLLNFEPRCTLAALHFIHTCNCNWSIYIYVITHMCTAHYKLLWVCLILFLRNKYLYTYKYLSGRNNTIYNNKLLMMNLIIGLYRRSYFQ